MGTLTTSQLEDEIRSALGGRTDLDSRLDRFINLAQVKIARTHDFEEMERVTASAFSYTATPADDKFFDLSNKTGASVRKIRAFRLLDDSNSRKLRYIPPRRWDKEIPEPEWYSTGRPSIFTKWRGKLELWKVPDSAYSCELRYSIWPAALSTSTPGGLSNLDNKDDLIIYLSVSWAFASLGKTEKAREFWRFYRNGMNDAIGEDVVEPDLDISPGLGGGSDGRILDNYWTDPFVRSMP